MILNAIVKGMFDSVLGKVSDAFAMWQKKQISEHEMQARIQTAITEAKGRTDVALADAEKEIYKEAQSTVRASFTAPSFLARNAWAFIAISQTLVLLWYQLGVPILTDLTGHIFARTGDDLLKWAYFLIGVCLGVQVWRDHK